MIKIPYVKNRERKFILHRQELKRLLDWLITVPVEKRKGFVAYIVNYLGKHSFTDDYFGKSTGLDAVRIAYREMEKELYKYEAQKKLESGEVGYEV